MASNKDFFEMYKHPLWQKKRLEVMQKAGFKCEHCSSQDNTLNVHHTFYKKNSAPWDYTNEELKCLCQDCHNYTHHVTEQIKIHLRAISSTDIAITSGFVKALAYKSGGEISYFFVLTEVIGFLICMGKYDWAENIRTAKAETEDVNYNLFIDLIEPEKYQIYGKDAFDQFIKLLGLSTKNPEAS